MKPMKVLIAYDASEYSREMLVDLTQAGLPDIVQADVVSFAEVSLSEPESVVASRNPAFDAAGSYSEVTSKAAFHRAIDLSHEGQNRIQDLFPRWTVTSQAHANAATIGTLGSVREWMPDLVIVGSHRRSPLGRLMFGSVGQTLLSQSPCSVRIARAPFGHEPAALRILLAVDGSKESNAAVRVVAARSWPVGTSVSVISVHDHGLLDTDVGVAIGPTAVGFDYDDIEDVEDRAAEALEIVRAAGLGAKAIVARGNPASAILEAAERWAADSIFMGARGHRLAERMLLGSVSNVVATRAHCSVEVVRSGHITHDQLV